MKNEQDLNQILFGPPGTGKTYHTVNKAIKIIDPVFYDKHKNDRKKLTDEFKKLLITNWDEYEGKRIASTTFHQSFTYEDFIEGIKPKIVDQSRERDEDNLLEDERQGDVAYQIQPGIFKKICERIKNIEKLTSNSLPTANSVSNFDELYSAFIKRLKEIISELKENETHTFQSRRSRVKLIKIENDDSILTTGESANSTETVTKDKLERIYNKYSSPDEITNLVKELREVGTDIGWTTNYFAVFKALKEFETSIKTNKYNNVKTKKKQDFVLIIDEINRGNVSQIFGELITLVEEDKRLGSDEALEVTLPYSKEKFGVPPNLYIIGTMNTADRSIEALDTALRRRFTFEEMAPKSSVIEGAGAAHSINVNGKDFKLTELLDKINGRLEKLLDKDHLIGHSYFMSISNASQLRGVFQKNIIPLLEEYFYGDKGKIQMVLGKGFIQKHDANHDTVVFADSDYEASSLMAEREVWKTTEKWKSSNADGDKYFADALETLMTNSKS